MMERLTEHDRPLYGRARSTTVAPFDPAECAEALGSGGNPLAAFDTALITGGYPRLVLDRARAHSTRAFVHEQLGDENSDLAVMGQRSLDAEFPDAQQARRVLSAMGVPTSESALSPKSSEGFPRKGAPRTQQSPGP